MKQIIEDIKQQIKEKKAELAKLEAALGKLTGDTVPKAARAPGSGTTAKGAGSASTATPSAPLPERIIAYLADFDDVAADNLAQALKTPLAQVRSTCSRLAKEGRIAVRKLGRTALYSGLKSEKPATENPFTETN